ncbi:hypothetical protein U1Q18_036311 [Sarracenia purpurea var. burkii]
MNRALSLPALDRRSKAEESLVRVRGEPDVDQKDEEVVSDSDSWGEGSDLESEDVETEGDSGEVASHKRSLTELGLSPPFPLARSSPKEIQGINDVIEVLPLVGNNFAPVLEGEDEVADKNQVGPGMEDE